MHAQYMFVTKISNLNCLRLYALLFLFQEEKFIFVPHICQAKIKLVPPYKQ